MPTIRLDNCRLTYAAVGDLDAPPLVMLHGWMSHRGVWRQTIEEFKNNYYCVALDLLGFGDSERPARADYSIKTQGQRVLQLADALGFDRFSLIGHSMGGQIGLSIAAILAPERIVKLINVAGVVSGRLTPPVERVIYPLVALDVIFPWLYILWRRLNRYRWSSYLSYRTWFHKMNAIPFGDWEIDRRMVFQSGGQISTYKAGQAIRRLNLTSQLSKITAILLTIFGQQDGVVPVSDGHLIKRYVSGSQLILIDQCGHFPMYEQTRQYLEALRTFLL